jgi:hypothetical protein
VPIDVVLVNENCVWITLVLGDWWYGFDEVESDLEVWSRINHLVVSLVLVKDLSRWCGKDCWISAN